MKIQKSDFTPRFNYQWCEPDVGVYTLLSVEPPILHVVHLENFEFLLHALRDRQVDYLLAFYWCINKDSACQLSRDIAFWMNQYPLARLHCLANSPAELDLLLASGCSAILCSHNAMVDERCWHPNPSINPCFDAMHDALLAPYKRHELAVKVPCLAIVSRRYKAKFDADYGSKIAQALYTANWFNHPMDPAHRLLSQSEVVATYWHCRVGLCLSAVEGACYASIQYLLTGLPVVSTLSLGGRDVFFNSQNALIVEPTPAAVRDGVATWIERAPYPETIRAATLPMVHQHRRAFTGLVNQILTDRNATADFKLKWPAVFSGHVLGRKPYELAARSVMLGQNLTLRLNKRIPAHHQNKPHIAG